jgi:hypothetical protein
MDQAQINLMVVLIASFLAFGTLEWNYGLIVPILLGGYLRWISFRNMFINPRNSYLNVLGAVLSHIVLFSSLFLLIQGDFEILEATTPVLDSLFYNVDTISTNGAVRIYPKTSLSKLFHILNILDSYFLFITLGFFILQNVTNPQVSISSQSVIRGTV